MVDSTSPDAGLNTLLTQYLFDDADVAKISPFVLSLLSADRLFETAARVDGSNVVKKWISRLQVLLHHADPKTRYGESVCVSRLYLTFNIWSTVSFSGYA